MNRQFVTLEIAQKLKKLGFDETCIGYYSNLELGKLRISQSIEHEGTNYTGIESCWLAPLWQQVIDWLRKVHNIDIALDLYSHRGGYSFNYLLSGMNRFLARNEDYFKAREEAVLKALELIKHK